MRWNAYVMFDDGINMLYVFEDCMFFFFIIACVVWAIRRSWVLLKIGQCLSELLLAFSRSRHQDCFVRMIGISCLENMMTLW
jgi:hypothetical protein